MKTRFAVFGIVSLSALTLIGQSSAIADELRFQNHEGQHASLVELYTSEGCSSCPPAEAWLSKLVDHPKLWTEIVPVSFHVDYWDNLGWRDRFASRAWTARQREYASAWGSSSVYTPGFVLDGGEWRDGSGGRAVPTPAKSEYAGRLEAVVKDGKTVTVVYHATGRASTAREVSIALLGCDLHSNVRAGENSGRNLRHDFVALSCDKKPLASDKGDGTAVFELPAVAAVDSKRLALAIWVEEPGRPGIQQATGGWLTDAAKTVQ